ncbi:MAG: rod shape-determining protein MreC [Succinivibrio sp.]|nr:rod shape-determining protein MreC [Succinivibrio sp.]
MSKPEQSGLIIHIRFALVVILSIGVMAVDLRSKALNDFRYYLETALYPVLAFADSPHKVSSVFSKQFKSHSELLEENEQLSSQNFEQRAEIMRLRSLETENEDMRRLLNSPSRDAPRRLFAEVLDVDSNPYLHRVVINRGTQAGVKESMPVITDAGLVGQVISTSYSFSRVLLLSDPSSSVPVVNSRTRMRALAVGSGAQDELLINNVPRSADVREGDLLLTSGLGGVYPSGYPVAVVSSIGFSESQPFALIKARPMVDIDKMRYVLLLWYQNPAENDDPKQNIAPKEPTDSKVALRQQRIKDLIESMSKPDAAMGTETLDIDPASVKKKEKTKEAAHD